MIRAFLTTRVCAPCVGNLPPLSLNDVELKDKPGKLKSVFCTCACPRKVCVRAIGRWVLCSGVGPQAETRAGQVRQLQATPAAYSLPLPDTHTSMRVSAGYTNPHCANTVLCVSAPVAAQLLRFRVGVVGKRSAAVGATGWIQLVSPVHPPCRSTDPSVTPACRS